MATWSGPAIKGWALRAGFTDAAAEIAAAVALAESSGNDQAVGDFGESFGLWQVHRPAHPQYSEACLRDPLCAAGAARDISQNGTNWQPWTQYRNGAYRAFLPIGEATDPVVEPIGKGTKPTGGVSIPGLPVDLPLPSADDVKKALIAAILGLGFALFVIIGAYGLATGAGRAVAAPLAGALGGDAGAAAAAAGGQD